MEDYLDPAKQKITAQKALELLAKRGVSLSAENAGHVVQFLYVLADIFYQQQQHRQS